MQRINSVALCAVGRERRQTPGLRPTVSFLAAMYGGVDANWFSCLHPRYQVTARPAFSSSSSSSPSRPGPRPLCHPRAPQRAPPSPLAHEVVSVFILPRAPQIPRGARSIWAGRLLAHSPQVLDPEARNLDLLEPAHALVAAPVDERIALVHHDGPLCQRPT